MAAFGGRKVRSLLRILATRRGRFVSHDELTDMLWGDHPPRNPAANVQVLINRARRAAGRGDLIVTGASGYSLTTSPDCSVDAEEFMTAVDRARVYPQSALDILSDALRAWAGDPLAEDLYEDWAVDYRSRLLRVRQLALEQAATLAIDSGRASMAVEFASTAAQCEPLREVAVLTLVRAMAATGDPIAALNRYEEFRHLLAAEMGLDPSESAVALQRELLTAGSSWVPVSHPVPRSVQFDALPFVGRERELTQIISAPGSTGRHLAVVTGSSGSGKSRLLQEFATAVRSTTIRAVLAERDEPWSLARSLVREILAGDATADHELPGALRSALAAIVPELDVPSPMRPDPESTRSLLVESTVRLAATIRGSVLIVDDLQWADASSLALLTAVFARVPDLAVVLAHRPEEVGTDSDVRRFLDQLTPTVRVTLPPLGPGDIRALIGDEQFASVLADVTDRSPLALTEVIRALVADGLVGRDADGRWRPTASGAIERSRAVAASGQRQAIAVRADRQAPQARELLNLLALLAREVATSTLAEASGLEERALLAMLTAAANAGLVRMGEQGWASAHDMITEVLAGRLTPAERGRLHTLIARALDNAEADPAERARHWLGAGDSRRAAHAYAAAAERALGSVADREGAELATAGLGVAPPGELSARLSEARAQCRARLGDISGARIDLRAALTAYPAGPVRARLLGRLASLASGADDLVRAAELAELALLEAGSDQAARAGALEIASVLDMNLDRRDRAEQRAGEALAIYQQIADAPGTARILDARAMATFLAGEVRAGSALLARVANLFEDSGDLTRVITPRSTSGHGSVFGGRAQEGLQVTSAALELARTLGHPEGQTYSLWHRTEALAALGLHAESLANAHEALSIALELGHRGWTATAWRATGIAHQSAGDLDRALAAFFESLAVSEHLDLFASWAASRAASVLIALGRLDDAAPLVERALGQGPPLGQYEARLARAELAAARFDEIAVAVAVDALRFADAGGVQQGRARLVELAAAEV